MSERRCKIHTHDVINLISQLKKLGYRLPSVTPSDPELNEGLLLLGCKTNREAHTYLSGFADAITQYHVLPISSWTLTSDYFFKNGQVCLTYSEGTVTILDKVHKITIEHVDDDYYICSLGDNVFYTTPHETAQRILNLTILVINDPIYKPFVDEAKTILGLGFRVTKMDWLVHKVTKLIDVTSPKPTKAVEANGDTNGETSGETRGESELEQNTPQDVEQVPDAG